MKKIVVILLLLIYGSATMGATIHLHFCMNEFVGWSLLHDNDDKCGKCGMEEKDKGACCKDEHKQFKLKTDHQKSGITICLNTLVNPAITTSSSDFTFQPFLKITERLLAPHAPPDINRERLYIFYGVFLI